MCIQSSVLPMSRVDVLFLSTERVELPVSRREGAPQMGVLVFALAAPIQIAFCGKSFYSRVRSVDQKQSAPLAQRIAQLPSKQWVVGSNPTGGTSLADDLSFQEEGGAGMTEPIVINVWSDFV